MLFRIIDAIRRKPKHVREQYAFGGAVIFTAVVVGVWSLSLPARFAVVSEGVSEANPPAAPGSARRRRCGPSAHAAAPGRV